MAKIERATIERKREFPEWLSNALDAERKKLTSIENEVTRKLAEIELDEIEVRTRTFLLETH